MPTIDHDPNTPRQDKIDAITVVSYLIAAAILAPIGWWLREKELFGFGAWVVNLFH